MDELEDALRKKDEDMKQMEERYKKYLEKAKSVSACSSSLLPWLHYTIISKCVLSR